MLHELRVEEDVLTSVYVTALFTSVPYKEIVQICVDTVMIDSTWSKRWGLTPEEFGESIELTLDMAYFQYKGQLYKQTYGVAILGFPISQIIANIFMEEFERKAL